MTRRGHTIEQVRDAKRGLSGLLEGPAVLCLDPAVGVAVGVGTLLRERCAAGLLLVFVVVVKTTLVAELLQELEFRVELRGGHAASRAVGVHAGASGGNEVSGAVADA